MKNTRQQAIRKLLLENSDGLTRQQISEALGFGLANTRTALLAMPDVFVDRWIMGSRKQYQKVYCAVYVPKDCPHPKDRVYPIPKPATVWRQLQA